MLALKEFRSRLKGLPDLLNWCAVIDKGVVLNKDGSFTTAFYFRGNDLGSSTFEELTALSAHANQALKKLGTGWLINVDSIRVQATTYPAENRSFFPDPTTRLIDAERRAQHETEGRHFDNIYALALTYQVPTELQNQVAAIFVDDDTDARPPEGVMARFAQSVLGVFGLGNDSARPVTAADKLNATRLLDRFKAVVADVAGSFSASLQMRAMSSDELLTYLHNCLTGESHALKMPPIPMYLDAILGSKDFYTGLAPRIGRKHIRVVSLFGFPGDTMPGILDHMNRLSFEYRWSTRFIPLDPRDAEKRLNVFRRNWFQKRHGLLGLVKSAAGGGEQTWVNGDAVRMAQDADMAVNENSEGHVRYGFFTSVIVVMGDSAREADDSANEVKKILDNSGFPSFIEDMNAVEAFMGSLPAHGFPNVRRPLIHTLNLADLLPLTAVWAGHESNPCPFYPPSSPPLLYAATSGSTPFRLSLHVGDLGHFALFGPPGAGKSTLLNTLIAQHFRYPNAQAFCFDFGYSMATLCEASGGTLYDIGSDTADARIGFCPLAQIDTPADRAWAAEFIAILYALRQPRNQDGSYVMPTVAQGNEIAAAIKRLADDSTGAAQRTLTHFLGTVQDNVIKEALKSYTVGVGGAIGDLLDAEADALAGTTSQRFFVFEMSHLFALGEQAIIPVMLHIFRQIEKRVNKSTPTLIPIDEAFRSFGHPLAIENLKKWLETMRKENVAVGFATQDINTVLTSSIATTIMNTVATKFLLPNPEAETEQVAPLYRALGLNSRQISNLAYARQKREYYMMNADGRRMFDLGLGQVALAFVGVSGKEQAQHVRALKAKHGSTWVYQWLQERGVPQDWTDYWLRLNKEMQQ